MISFPNAKINLGLDVIRKRSDGFHDIESVLIPIPFCDVLEFKTSKSFSIKSHGVPIDVDQKENILFKTWELLNQVYKIPPLEVHLLKSIPPMSGLGGGSSDSAALILSANKFFKLDLTLAKMKSYANQIGSDCSFFIENKTAVVSGRGEIIKLLNLSLKGLFLVLIYPDVKISTKQAYDSVKPQLPKKSVSKIILQPIEKWEKELVNAFENPAFSAFPQLKKIKQDLYSSGAAYASLSGSGSAIYGIFHQPPKLNSALSKQVIWSGFISE